MDAAAITQVHLDTWKYAYRGVLPDAELAQLSYPERERGRRKALLNPRQGVFTLVAEDAGGAIVGFTAAGPVWPLSTPRKGRVFALFVSAACQGCGIGRALLVAAAQRLAAADLFPMQITVLEAEPAQRFCIHLGGRLTDERTVLIGSNTYREHCYEWQSIDELRGAGARKEPPPM